MQHPFPSSSPPPPPSSLLLTITDADDTSRCIRLPVSMSSTVSTALDEETRPRERRGPSTARSRKNSEYGLEEGLLLQVRNYPL
jgi:hypothetical protein